MGDRFSEKRKGFSDVRDNGFEQFRWFNCIVVSIRYWSISGDRNTDGRWVLSQMFQDGGPEIQGRISFSRNCFSQVRCRDKSGVGSRHCLLLGGHGGLSEIKLGR